MAEFEIPTADQFAAITRQTAERMKHQLLAVSARYDRRGGRVMIVLNNGAVVGFPLASLPGLECATPDELGHIAVEGGGYGLHVARLDADISVPQLLADQLGSTMIKRALVRASAWRANGQLGGRPRKSQAA